MLIALDKIFSDDPSPYVLLDRDLRITWANAAYLSTTGRSAESILGRIMTEAFPAPPESVPDQMLRMSLRRVLETGHTDHLPLIPYPIIAPDGSAIDRYWSATHTPIMDGEGRVEYILQNTNDVTEIYRESNTLGAPGDKARVIRRAEAVAKENLALGAAVNFVRSAFDQAPSFMVVLKGRDLTFQIVNESYLQLVGHRDLIGKTLREGLPELEGQGFYELLEQVYDSGEAVTRRGAEVRLRPLPGGPEELRFVDFIFSPMKDPDGTPNGIFVEGHDVTRQKLAEAELIATQERFRTMAQSMPNHVWSATPEGVIDWVNDRIYAYTGVAEGQLYDGHWIDVVHPEDAAGAGAVWAAAVESTSLYQTEFRIRSADGSYRWHIVRAVPLRDASGAVERWIGTNTDIEDRKAAESALAQLNATLEERVEQRNRELEALHATLRQSQKMEAIGNLAGGIAHDFNNLLQTITGSLQLALRGLEPDSPVRPRLDQAMKAVGRGATLASQLLSFGRRQPLAPKVINLSRLLRDADHIVRSAIGEAVEVETIVAGGLWNTCVDPANVESAILNLAINARDAMNGQGRLTIEIGNAYLDDAYARAHVDVTPGQYVMLAVTDTGCGMPPEIIEKVFEPFFTTKPEGRGTGLGMSMVYGFVKQSGGHVKIYSEVGNGTSIKIYLPRSLEAEDAARPAQSGPMTGGSETILLVEDDEDVRATAAGLLADLGYTVLQARDADRAMTIVESGARIDLLFTDVVMPGRMTSRQMAEKARLMMPKLAVLFTSGYTQNSIVHGGRLDAGVQLLSKPYTQEALARKLREVLAKPAPVVEQPVAEPAPPAAPLAGLRVLVCEDDVIIRMNLSEVLQEAGCSVLEAGNGKKALALLETGPVDAVLIDLGLPDMSGMDLAATMRDRLPDLPVVFATGQTHVAGVEAMGRAQVLTKPFGDDALIETLLAVLGRTA
ncbi:MAG: Sensor protein [Cereibacter sp.]|nr:Sensor protein [Cereibacter sp.]